MKNTVKTLLCLALILCSILFVSCDPAEESKDPPAPQETTPQETAPEETEAPEPILNYVDMDISAYTVIYSQNATISLNAAVADYLAKDISRVRVTDISSLSDEAEQTEKEILIGDTNRAESAEAKTMLTEKGFVISVINDKIVIVGSDDIQTLSAVNYFTEKYLTSNLLLSVPEKEVRAATDLAFSDAYTFVFAEGLDDTAGNTIGTTDSRNARDYPCVAADDLIRYMEVSNENIKRATDNHITDFEVLIGKVNRDAYSSFAETLAENEYGILVKDGKIIFAGYNNLALEKCIARFKELLSVTKDGSSWLIPEGLCVRGVANDDWIVDFTRPEGEGIALYNTMDSNDDSLQFLYTGSGVNSAAFDRYCQQLTGEGYKAITENTIEDSKFMTLVNSDKGITLYVAYNDFKYEAEYAVEDKFYVDYEKCIRIISAPLSSVTLPDSDMLTPDPSYTKVANSSLTTVGLTHRAVGMSYIIRLEDGSFIIFDGGYVSGLEHKALLETLYELHADAYGSDPSAENPIRICAWVITHSHQDHYGVFKQFLRRYGNKDTVKIEALIANFPPKNILYAAAAVYTEIKNMGEDGAIAELQSYVNGGFKYIKVHSGQKLYFANLTMEVLMTYEDHNPASLQEDNDTCTVVRLSIATTDAQNGSVTSAASAVNTVTAVFLADAQRYQSRYLCSMYGSYLRSDMVQLAHHGNRGCEIPVYDLISPTVVLWPECQNHIPMYMDPTKDTGEFFYEVDRYVANMSSVKYIIGANEWHDTTFDFAADGPTYETLYDASTGNSLDFDGVTLIKR